MIVISYQSHVTGNGKLYRETLQQIRQWTYAHAGHRRSQAARYFAGGAKARNYIWEQDDIVIRIRQLANIATVINVKAGVGEHSADYHAQVYAFAIGELRTDPEAETANGNHVLASVISETEGFAPPWDCQEAGEDAMSQIIDRVRDRDRPGGGQPRPVTVSPQPAENPASIRITRVADLRQDAMPTLVVPQDAPQELRQLLAPNTSWCDIGYADPAACLAIARSLPDPETAGRWLQGELAVWVEETGAVSTLPVAELDIALARLRRQYNNTLIYQTVSMIGMLTELLAHNINPNTVR